MSTIPVDLAIEDELSEAVLRRVLTSVGRGYAIGQAYGRTGFGYLKKTIKGWNRAARGRPFVMLTDLDDSPCPSALMQDWLKDPKHSNLMFRVAVREVEAWLLADAENLARYLDVRLTGMPPAPDSLPNPKQTLVDLARTSGSSRIRTAVAPKWGSTAKQGPDYNACLSNFVADAWSVAQARQRSPSLNRAFERFSAFRPVWER